MRSWIPCISGNASTCEWLLLFPAHFDGSGECQPPSSSWSSGRCAQITPAGILTMLISEPVVRGIILSPVGIGLYPLIPFKSLDSYTQKMLTGISWYLVWHLTVVGNYVRWHMEILIQRLARQYFWFTRDWGKFYMVGLWIFYMETEGARMSILVMVTLWWMGAISDILVKWTAWLLCLSHLAWLCTVRKGTATQIHK